MSDTVVKLTNAIDATEKFRTRWRRWRGSKTRCDTHHWTTLLESKWAHWASDVLDKLLPWQGATRESVKAYWARAIDEATMYQLQKLDNIYASEKLGL